MRFDVEQATSLLVEGHRQRRQVQTSWPGPSGSEEAYAVQAAVARRLGSIGGWKVGAKSSGEIPNAAPMLAELIRPSPVEWPKDTLHMRGVEAEIAFHIGRDIGPRTEPLGEDEIFAAVDSVHVAIEVVDTRLADWKNADRLWVLADNQSNGGFVYDPAGVPWRGQDFTDAAVRLTIDGQTAVEGRGGNPAGDPRWLLVWLVNHCVRHRGGLTAGTFVTTGSYTGMIFVDPGATVEAEFSGLGRAVVRFA
jgi:2-keto-4-pentenoate hydratase